MLIIDKQVLSVISSNGPEIYASRDYLLAPEPQRHVIRTEGNVKMLQLQTYSYVGK